jgi:hypothetical protein
VYTRFDREVWRDPDTNSVPHFLLEEDFVRVVGKGGRYRCTNPCSYYDQAISWRCGESDMTAEDHPLAHNRKVASYLVIFRALNRAKEG